MNAGHKGLAITYDAGDNWKLLDSSGALYLGFASDSVGWSSPHQHNNGVWKYVGPRLITSVESGITAPASYLLAQNYPNPFNPSTTIRYGLPNRSHVTLAVFNTLGQSVSTLVNGEREAGYHEVRFDASGLSSGVYLYRIQAGDFVQTRKFVLLK